MRPGVNVHISITLIDVLAMIAGTPVLLKNTFTPDTNTEKAKTEGSSTFFNKRVETG
ncbi:hypothetical protein MDMS009_2206 [Methylophaga thiooxydans DMS010]|uniref:Uncharacterized protein n=1 Tax=Methylophaga thiooxydans DMS010 TaxID=637616 RepID=C0N7H6_9GAMM|nr:hypothetical protein MDMS009_2206 [Methylophaga thiooxydans DMS010]